MQGDRGLYRDKQYVREGNDSDKEIMKARVGAHGGEWVAARRRVMELSSNERKENKDSRKTDSKFLSSVLLSSLLFFSLPVLNQCSQ